MPCRDVSIYLDAKYGDVDLFVTSEMIVSPLASSTICTNCICISKTNHGKESCTHLSSELSFLYITVFSYESYKDAQISVKNADNIFKSDCFTDLQCGKNMQCINHKCINPCKRTRKIRRFEGRRLISVNIEYECHKLSRNKHFL